MREALVESFEELISECDDRLLRLADELLGAYASALAIEHAELSDLDAEIEATLPPEEYR